MEQRLDDLCFEEDWLDQPLERDTELPTGAPVSKKALQKLFSKISTPPDISKGLGKHQEKRDISQLEQFVTDNLPLMMYEGELYLYEPPYWKKLSKREAKKKIRTLLEKECQIDYLTESKYQKILNLPIINSDISEERTLTSPRDKVNMLDGAYDLQTGELLPHNAEDYFFTCINVYGREMDMCREDTFEAFVRNCSDGDPVVRKQLLQLVALTILGKPLLLFAENHPIPKADMKQEFYKDLLEEAPYIVREALDEYRELEQNNFQLARSELPPEFMACDSRERDTAPLVNSWSGSAN